MFKIVNFNLNNPENNANIEAIAGAFNKYEIDVDTDSFVKMWAENLVKVILEIESEQVVGISCFRYGKHTFANGLVASILVLESDKSLQAAYEFACSVAQAVGCVSIASTMEQPLDGVEVSGYYQERIL